MKWKKEEFQKLEEMYEKGESVEKIAEELGRTEDSVRWKASYEGLAETQEDEWSEEEFSKLYRNYSTTDTKKLAKKIGRSYEAVTTKAKEARLEKEPNHQIKKRIREKGIREFDESEKRGYFFAGLVAGEGCFTSGENQFFFQVTMSQRDDYMVHELRDFMGVGSIIHGTREGENHDDITIYKVSGVADIVTNVIPFFETYGLGPSYKGMQYYIWKKQIQNQYDLDEFIGDGIRDVE